jgi:hypothetical protein
VRPQGSVRVVPQARSDGVLLEGGRRDDEALHLRGTFVYLGYSRVAVVALSRHLANVTHAAKHLRTKPHRCGAHDLLGIC